MREKGHKGLVKKETKDRNKRKNQWKLIRTVVETKVRRYVQWYPQEQIDSRWMWSIVLPRPPS